MPGVIDYGMIFILVVDFYREDYYLSGQDSSYKPVMSREFERMQQQAGIEQAADMFFSSGMVPEPTSVQPVVDQSKIDAWFDTYLDDDSEDAEDVMGAQDINNE